MKNSVLNCLLMAVFLLTVAAAQPPGKIARIGYLSSRDPASDSVRSGAVRLGLRELGYIEGQNISIEYRFADGKREQFRDLAADSVRLKVDVIVVAGGTPSVREAMKATKTIPIVMSGGGADPVDTGLVQSLAYPGGNVTGITNLTGGTWLELLKEAVPKVARIAVLYEPANPSSVLELQKVLPVAARALNLVIQSWEEVRAISRRYSMLRVSSTLTDSTCPRARS